MKIKNIEEILLWIKIDHKHVSIEETFNVFLDYLKTDVGCFNKE